MKTIRWAVVGTAVAVAFDRILRSNQAGFGGAEAHTKRLVLHTSASRDLGGFAFAGTDVIRHNGELRVSTASPAGSTNAGIES